MHKIMPDTNTFDFLYDNNQINKLIELIEKGNITLVICQVQSDEIDKIGDETKKNALEKIPWEKIPSSIGWVGVEDRYNRGYLAPKVNGVKTVSVDDAKIVNKYRRGRTETHPVGNEGDLAIVFTAIKEGMDYLISDDEEVSRVYEGLKVDYNSNLEFLDNQTFVNQLTSWN